MHLGNSRDMAGIELRATCYSNFALGIVTRPSATANVADCLRSPVRLPNLSLLHSLPSSGPFNHPRQFLCEKEKRSKTKEVCAEVKMPPNVNVCEIQNCSLKVMIERFVFFYVVLF